jgi:tRNA modification GTPase
VSSGARESSSTSSSASAGAGQSPGFVAPSGAVSDALAVPVSAKTGAGLTELREALSLALGGEVADAVVSSSERHVRGLGELVEALERARLAASVSTLEVVAGELSLALSTLAELDGSDARAELLDAIFQRFCIGK